MTLVVDASVVVAALVDGGETGRWAEGVLLTEALVAPHLLPAEVANVLRRAVLADDVSADTASLAHGDLQALRLELFPYRPIAERAWALRGSLSVYDAWYVALAEWLEVALATLDHRVARAHGPECEFVVPPD